MPPSEPAARRRCPACKQALPAGAAAWRQGAPTGDGCGMCGAPLVRAAQAEDAADPEDSGAHVRPNPGTAAGRGRYG